LTIEPAPAAVFVGQEGDPSWRDQRSQTPEWKGKDGWGYARIELASGRATRLVLRDSRPAKPNPLRCPVVRAPIEMDLPEQRFADCLHAQVAHLMMGLLDRRTPPGEPTNYPLAWQRDGVAVVAGLARAGQLEVARELACYFAENDFFGGFGSEGDAPGQGLRVMEDVAVHLDLFLPPQHQPTFLHASVGESPQLRTVVVCAGHVHFDHQFGRARVRQPEVLFRTVDNRQVRGCSGRRCSSGGRTACSRRSRRSIKTVWRGGLDIL
jgi:hypothetical protein